MSSSSKVFIGAGHCGAVVFRCRGFGRGHDILIEAQLQARIA